MFQKFPLAGKQILPCLVSVLLSATAGAAELRQMAYRPGTAEQTRAWQEQLREKLFTALHLDDLRGQPLALEARPLGARQSQGLSLREIRLRATSTRDIDVLYAVPKSGDGPWPAVVCIHGHGGGRATPFDPDKPIYKSFGVELVLRGFAVLSLDVGQHDVREAGRTLMGERLWDLMRGVDYLASLPEIDPKRIGCAGLSLGGEMAMWLGAMDPRIAATVSCGFLTRMDQMEQNHCMCWKFPGLRALADFADLYALAAPRPLQCQNGAKEPATQFTVALAQEALKEIVPAYAAFGAEERVELEVHPGGHEIALDALVSFLARHLKSR